MSPERRAAALLIATAIAIPAEGLYQKAYRDPPGILTVCYGHTRKVDPNKVYSKVECRSLLDDDMGAAVDTVERCVPGLPVHVLAAFSDAVYNLGSTIACNIKESTAARMLAARKLADACRQLPRWNKARIAGVLIPLPGLTNRRAVEMEVCLNGSVPRMSFALETLAALRAAYGRIREHLHL